MSLGVSVCIVRCFISNFDSNAGALFADALLVTHCDELAFSLLTSQLKYKNSMTEDTIVKVVKLIAGM